MTAAARHPRREAARVLLVDPAGRLLLMRSGEWWFTVGGGREAGETPEQAAVRETAEETGVRLDPAALGQAVHEVTATVLRGDQWFEQHEIFFAAAADGAPPNDAGWTALERDTIDEVRWWSEAELRATTARLAPPELPDLLAGVVAART